MRLALLGDMAFFGKCSLATNPNAKDYFAEVANFLEKADYVVGNLVTPFSVKKKTHGAKSAYLCSDIVNVELLKYLHVDAVTLANNHMFDYGKEGYETTKRVLTENRIDFFGSEGKGLDVDFEDNRLSFEGFCCYTANPIQTVPYGEYGINEYNYEVANKLLTKHEAEGRLTILAVHAGLEHINYPSLDHVRIARKFATDHNYIYYGHHPHVSQGLEFCDQSLLAYSLGNFCFDDIWSPNDTHKPQIELTENNRSTFILEVSIEQNIVREYSVIPVFIGKDKMTVGKGTTEEILKLYTDFINNTPEDEYNKERNNILSKRIQERKDLRNLQWYIKRLRPRYLKLIIEGRRNKEKYIKNIKQYI